MERRHITAKIDVPESAYSHISRHIDMREWIARTIKGALGIYDTQVAVTIHEPKPKKGE